MSKASASLKIALVLVMVASAIELGFVSATVGYLARLSNSTISVWVGSWDEPFLHIPGLPASLSVNQGHTANAAAGTGLIIISFAGFFALWLRGRPGYHDHSIAGRFNRFWYRLWLALQLPALLLTLGALAYVFSVTNMYAGQTIQLTAVQADSDAYPLLEWTPQGWFVALSKLRLAMYEDEKEVEKFVKITRGWQYNLIPFFLVQLVETVLALMDARRRRRREDSGERHGEIEKGT